MMRLAVVSFLLIALALSGCASKDSTGGTTTGGMAGTTGTGTTHAMNGTATSTSSTTSSASATNATAPPRAAKTFEVDIKGNSFVDGTLTIQKGDTIHWVHMDGTTPHSVVSDSGKFSSDTAGAPCPGPGCMTSVAHNTFDYTFAEVGSYPYHCEVHASMKNTITVVASLPA